MTVFYIIATVTLLTAVAAMGARSLVHCALFAALTFTGLSALFLQLNAQFVGLAQILVYVGAVAILIVFAILLTRGSETTAEPILSPAWWVGLAVAGGVCLTLVWSVLASIPARAAVMPKADVANEVAVRQIGIELMTRWVVPLEIIGLLLTAATIGAVIVALPEKEPKR